MRVLVCVRGGIRARVGNGVQAPIVSIGLCTFISLEVFFLFSQPSHVAELKRDRSGKVSICCLVRELFIIYYLNS